MLNTEHRKVKTGTEKNIENDDCTEMNKERLLKCSLMIHCKRSRVQQKHARYQQLGVKWTL